MADTNPSAINIFSQISSRSGTTTVIGLNSVLRPSGNSALPKYPGFIVIKAPHVGSNEISSPSITNLFAFLFIASVILLNYTEHTERVSGNNLLNSSKQPQQPELANPLYILPIDS